MPASRSRVPAAHVAPPGKTSRTGAQPTPPPPAQSPRWNVEREELGVGHTGNGGPSPRAQAANGRSPPEKVVAVCEVDVAEGSEDGALTSANNTYQPLDPSMPVDSALLYRNLWLFIWLKAVGSYDSGAFSAAVGTTDGISDSWGLSYIQQGTLTSSVFLGNIIGCPLAGHLFSQYSEKHVLNASLVVHTVFTFLFASFPSYYVALFNRFFIGLSLAFIVVYTPVWVDAFAPKDRQSVWMASHNSGVPLGIMLGYLAALFFTGYTSVSWEWAFYVKCVLMLPTIAYVAKVDTRSINTLDRGRKARDTEAGEDTVAGTSPENAANAEPPSRSLLVVIKAKAMSIWAVTKPLLGNPVYMCSVLAMCSLYFVATGLQNYVTEYLLNEPFNASTNTLMAGFGASVVSAPVCGVIAGGLLLDKFGGYQGNLLRVACFALVWGTLAAIFSVVCIFVETTFTFLLVMSVVLFCGGAIIPPGAGLTMSSLPDHLRSFGAAFSQFLYNTLGNFSGPLVCSFVAEKTGKLKYGIYTLLLSSGIGLIPMSIILFVALKQAKNPQQPFGGRPHGGSGQHGNAEVVVIEDGDDSSLNETANGPHARHGDDRDMEMTEREAMEEFRHSPGSLNRPIVVRPMSHCQSPPHDGNGEAMVPESIMNLHRRQRSLVAAEGSACGNGCAGGDPIEEQEEEEEEWLPAPPGDANADAIRGGSPTPSPDRDTLVSEAGHGSREQRYTPLAMQLPRTLPLGPSPQPAARETHAASGSPGDVKHPVVSGVRSVAGTTTADTPGATATDLSGTAEDREHGVDDDEEEGAGEESHNDRVADQMERSPHMLSHCSASARPPTFSRGHQTTDGFESRQLSDVDVRGSASFGLSRPPALPPRQSSAESVGERYSVMVDAPSSARHVSPSLSHTNVSSLPSTPKLSAHVTPATVSPASIRLQHRQHLKDKTSRSHDTSFRNRASSELGPSQLQRSPELSRLSHSSVAMAAAMEQAREEETFIRLEADAANAFSIPNQHMFGLDLVRSWLHTQTKDRAAPHNSNFPSRLETAGWPEGDRVGAVHEAAGYGSKTSSAPPIHRWQPIAPAHAPQTPPPERQRSAPSFPLAEEARRSPATPSMPSMTVVSPSCTSR